MKFCELTEEEFSKFEENSSYGNFFQTTQRAKLREKMGFRSFLVGVKDDKKVLAAGLAIEKKGEVWVQIGPVLDWKNIDIVNCFLSGIVDFCKEKKFTELEIFPPVLLSTRDAEGNKIESFDCTEIYEAFKKNKFSYMGLTNGIEFKALRWMFVKDLSGFKDMREAELSFNASTRKKLHQTQRNLDVYVLKDKSELKDWILPLYDSNKRNGINTRDLSYFENIWDIFGDKVMFLESRLKETGEIVSSEVDFWHKNELVAFLAGMSDEYKKYNGNTAIKGWQIEECLKRGQKRLNLYGIEADFSESNPLLKFKSGFSGVVEEYIGGFKIVLRPAKFYFSRFCRKGSNFLRRFSK